MQGQRREERPLHFRIRTRLQGCSRGFREDWRTDSSSSKILVRLLVVQILAVLRLRVCGTRQGNTLIEHPYRRHGSGYGLARDMDAQKTQFPERRVWPAHRMDRLHLAEEAVPEPGELPAGPPQPRTEDHIEPASSFGHPALRRAL